MQEFTIFDMVILGITLVLGLKGLFKGLIKEVFGIIGIIGAIYFASRVSVNIGELIAPLLALENQTTIKLIGFIIALIGFWLIVYILGVIVSKIFSASGLGLFDRIFGFIFGAAKVFLIFSVIAYSIYQIESFKNTINKKTENSIMMPHLLSVGGYIIKLDTSAITNGIGNTVDKVVDTTKDLTSENNSTSKKIQETTKEAKENIQTTFENAKVAVQEEIIDEVKKKLNETKDSLTK